MASYKVHGSAQYSSLNHLFLEQSVLQHTIVVHYQDLGRSGGYHPCARRLKCHCEGPVWLESNLVVNNWNICADRCVSRSIGWDGDHI